jgi:hypothetical protein
MWRQQLARLADNRFTRWTAAIVFPVTLALWVAYSGVYYRTVEPLAVAGRGFGVLGEVCARQGAIQFVVLKQGGAAAFKLERMTQLGNAGWSHRGAVSGLGFAFACLPKGFTDRDLSVPAHVAVAIPYWFLAGLTGIVIGRWIWLASRPHSERDFNRGPV